MHIALVLEVVMFKPICLANLSVLSVFSCRWCNWWKEQQGHQHNRCLLAGWRESTGCLWACLKWSFTWSSQWQSGRVWGRWCIPGIHQIQQGTIQWGCHWQWRCTWIGGRTSSSAPRALKLTFSAPTQTPCWYLGTSVCWCQVVSCVDYYYYSPEFQLDVGCHQIMVAVRKLWHLGETWTTSCLLRCGQSGWF